MATVITLDPIASALESFRDHIEATAPGGTLARRGIQELGNAQAGDVSEYSLEMISREIEHLIPTAVDIGSQGAQVDVQWKVAQLRLRIQMDLWAPYRILQDIFGPSTEGLFYNRLPHQGGLHLVSTHYFDRPLTITAGAGVDIRDSQAVAEGSWQRRWDVEILTDLVVVSKLPKMSEILISLSTQLGPDIVAEPDRSVT